MKITGAQILVETLIEQGVDTIFGFPGGAVTIIYDALYKNSDRIRHITTCHEQGAAHAADGYARSTGKVGVVLATSGPGATNLITGITAAYLDSVPMVAITGNVSRNLLGKDSFQEVDITGITMPVTKHNFLVCNVADLADTVRHAFEIASSGRPGPVLIDITKDVTGAECDFSAGSKVEKASCLPSQRDINIALQMIEECSQPLLFMGGGCVSSCATEELLALSQRLSAPMCTSIMGLGSVPRSHPMFMGILGMHGSMAANFAASECDLLIAIGTRFSDRAVPKRTAFPSSAKIIHIDIDAAEIDKNIPTNHSVSSDAKLALTAILEKVTPKSNPAWLESLASWKKKDGQLVSSSCDIIKPAALFEKVKAIVGNNEIIVTDVGQHQMWVAQYYDFETPRTLLTSGGLGAMGYGTGAAIGAQVANPDKQVVLFTGDGSFHMNLAEIATMVSYNLPIKVIILNNGVLGMVRQWQRLFFEERYSQTSLNRKTDFKALALAFGAHGFSAATPVELDCVLEQAFKIDGPCVIDCKIHPDEAVLPMIPAGGTLDNIITTY